jgi:hypothetical protein
MCKYYSCSDDGGCTWSATESTCQQNTDCLASNDWYNEQSDEFYEDENYEADNYEAENYEAASEGYDRDYIDGGSDGLNHAATSANKNFTAYFIIAGVLGVFIMVAVWRKRVRTNTEI